jgi:DMSO/TMAO reductase YedYZ molybdopterin-dependent catalytic subunit
VAFERDGQPLGAEIGPFRLVVPTDKRGGRWVRQVVSIKLLD